MAREREGGRAAAFQRKRGDERSNRLRERRIRNRRRNGAIDVRMWIKLAKKWEEKEEMASLEGKQREGASAEEEEEEEEEWRPGWKCARDSGRHDRPSSRTSPVERST